MNIRAMAGIAVAAGALWLYLPPIGKTIDLPDLKPFLEPDVPHENGTFIETGNHIYYQTRLNAVVDWKYPDRYYDLLSSRGVQFRAITTSPHAIFPHATGWKIAMAREKTVTPYAIEYWKSDDFSSGSHPIRLRWPWLYVRLSRDVKDPRSAVLVPDHDVVADSVPLPRYPGAVLLEAEVYDAAIIQRFVAGGSEEEILTHYAELPLSRSNDTKRLDHTVIFHPQEPFLSALGGPRAVQVDVDSALFSDDPLVIFDPAFALKLPPYGGGRQASTLEHMPDVRRYRLELVYDTHQKAREVFSSWSDRPSGPKSSMAARWRPKISWLGVD